MGFFFPFATLITVVAAWSVKFGYSFQMTKMMRPLIENLCEKICDDMPNRELLATTDAWLRTNFQTAALRPLAPQLVVYLASQTQFVNDPTSLRKHVQEELGKQ